LILTNLESLSDAQSTAIKGRTAEKFNAGKKTRKIQVIITKWWKNG
jgi:hypothetical protein